MEWLKLCLLVGSVFAFCESAKDYYFVIAPNLIRFNHQETLLVNIFGNRRNVPVSVWLEYRGKRFSMKNVTVPDEKTPVSTTIIVTVSDIFNADIDEKARVIRLCSRRGNENQICNDIVLSYKTGYLIVQTDKPIYTPLQKVKIRVLALDESLKKVSGDQWQINMDIMSPSNLTLGRRIFQSPSSSGFYQSDFALPSNPEIGIWTARAFYGGQYETVGRSLFQIEEYVLPTFGVTIDVSQPYILLNQFEESKVDITVMAKYVYGKPVAGTAKLSLNVTYPWGGSNYLFNVNRKELEQGHAEFSIKLRDNIGFDGSRLVVIATVFESATGKVESTFNDATVFTREPFVFKFTRCKRYFRKGMDYYVKVDMYTPNGVPAAGKNITLAFLNVTGGLIDSTEARTDSNGQALVSYSGTSYASRLRFKVLGPGSSRRQESDIFEAIAYDDKNQILVECFTIDNKMLMKVFSNVQLNNTGPSYTGMLFVVISQGKIIRSIFKPAGNTASEHLDDILQKRISPTGRLLVFYVDEQLNKVVADSIKIEVDAKCRAKGLSLKPEQNTVIPGSTHNLIITGTPFSWVGLNVMDKALLLLNDENILTKNKMFDALRSHDLGCGEGSGKNNGDVFKNAGVSILTNANIELDMYRSNEGCDPNSRKRRATDVCNGADERCCVYGKWYAAKVFNETAKDERAKIDSYTLCYSAARKAFETYHYAIRCIQSILTSCIDKMETLISKITQLMSRSLEDVSYYARGLKALDENKIKPHIRTNFRKSFMFEEVQLNKDGQATKIYNYPDSITEWKIQAIGITENSGMCIADPVDVKVFREFFIKLDLPYKATRFELFEVKATLFNYGHEKDLIKQANMYLEAVEGLCYGATPGKPSPRKSIEVGPNSATTVRFPIIPLKAGKFSVKVTAIVVELGIPTVDIIEKHLYVENEGIQEIISIQVCLDPTKQSKDCEDGNRVKTTTQYSDAGKLEQNSTVDLFLPKHAIKGTGSATAYLQANIMDNVVQFILSGVGNYFRMPYGCPEQTCSSTAPNVYALMYLKKTKQATTTNIMHGYRYIREGIDRLTSKHRLADGSYEGSAWLTAFAAKILCHADFVVDDGLETTNDLQPTINYLANLIGENFKGIRNSWYNWMSKGATKDGYKPSITAFVLISLLECNVMQSNISYNVDQAAKFLEALDLYWLTNNPFDLAITTYALALAKSKNILRFKHALDSIMKSDGNNYYWTKYSNSSGDAYSGETTAYALLAMLQFDDMATATNIARWMTSRQTARGVFKSTQDTVVGLQALSEYSIRQFTPVVDLVVFPLNYREKNNYPVKNEKFQRHHIIDKLPVEKGDSTFKFRVTGTSGSGRMRIELRYNRPAKDDEICPFDISNIDVDDVYKLPNDINIARLGNCDVCGRCADPTIIDYDLLTTEAPATVIDYDLLTTDATVDVNISSSFGRKKRQAQNDPVENMKCIRFNVSALPDNEHGMSMIYIHLETDVTVLKEDMEKIIKENENVDDYEMPTNGNGLAVFYLNTLTSHRNDFVFRLKDNFRGDKLSRQPASVDVFDYYDPDKYCRKMYGTGPKKGAAVDYKCNSNKLCKCLTSSCSVSVDAEILKMLKRRQKPAVKLIQYTCNPDKANFADIVKVKELLDDPDSKNKMAITEVTTSVHPGLRDHVQGDNLTFFWKSSCDFPKLQKDKQYLIIGKDGFRTQDANGNDTYLYSAMGSTLLIKPKGRIKSIIKVYKEWMKKKGCVHK